MSCSRLASLPRQTTNIQKFPALHVAARVNPSIGSFSFGIPQRPSFSSFHTSSRKLQEESKSKEEDAEKIINKEATPDPKDSKIQELEAEVAELKNRLIYSNAERENIRRIAREDVAKEKDYGITSFAKQMLDVADNLSRCLASVRKDDLFENKGLKTLIEGVELTERDLIKVFQKNGINRFEPVNEKFDPNKMNALLQTPQEEGKEPGNVSQVFKVGYTLKERVLRPADVAVVAASN